MSEEPYVTSWNIYSPFMADKKKSPLSESQVVDIDVDASTTEEYDSAEDMDELIREETRNWLDLHGSKLYALEFSKYLAQERKREGIKKKR